MILVVERSCRAESLGWLAAVSLAVACQGGTLSTGPRDAAADGSGDGGRTDDADGEGSTDAATDGDADGDADGVGDADVSPPCSWLYQMDVGAATPCFGNPASATSSGGAAVQVDGVAWASITTGAADELLLASGHHLYAWDGISDALADRGGLRDPDGAPVVASLLAGGDVDGDGLGELVVFSGTAVHLHDRATGELTEGVELRTPAGGALRATYAAVVAGGPWGEGAHLLVGAGGELFEVVTEPTLGLVGPLALEDDSGAPIVPLALVSSDLDGDRIQEFYAVDGGGAAALEVVDEAGSTCRFGPRTPLTLCSTGAPIPMDGAAAADLGGDGSVDLIAVVR